MSEFKHNHNRVIEVVAKLLEKIMNFNQSQVIRYFQIFPMNVFSDTPQVPMEELENWYYLRDIKAHNSLIYNFETGEYKLIDPEFKWQGEFIEEYQKSEEELFIENIKYVEKMNEIIDSDLYKKLKPLIKWYFSCPIGGARDVLPSPNEFILKVLKKYSIGFKLENENLKDVRDSLFKAYHYEERKEEKDSNNNIK